MPSSLGQYKGVNITPGAQSDIQAQMAAIDSGTSKPIKPITPNDLTSTSPMTVPTVPASTASASFQGQMEAFTAGLQANADEAKATKDQSGKMLADAMFSSQGETALTDQLYSQEGGVDQTKAELDDLNAQILQEQEGLRREIEDIENNSEGLTRGAVVNRVDEARRKSLRTQADLAVIQYAKQGKYDSAKAIADRAVAVQLEKQKQNLDNLRFIYEENKEDWTKAEQRAFETNQRERERKLENEEYRLRAEFDQKIRQNDPLYQAQIRAQNLQTQKLQQELGMNYNMQMTQQEFDALPSADKNNTTLLQIMSNPKISAGTRTSISSGLAIARAAQDLAGANPDGTFAGIYPFRGLIERFYPGSSPLKRSITVANTAALDAIHLNTQYWASGAALTPEQTEKVNSLIPTISDTDATARTKLNSLVDYMNTHTAAKLAAEGINYQPVKVNLFETADLLKQASPEQLEALKASGAI